MKYDNKHWQTVKVSDLGKIVTGKTPKTSNPEYYGGAIPFLTPSDDMSVKYVKTTKRNLSWIGMLSVKNACLPPASVCVSCIGSDLGKVVITSCETVSNQQINSIIVNQTHYDVDFVYYAMIILGKKINYLSKTSTAVPIVNKRMFSNFTIECPCLAEQKKIASLLSFIDDKIATNTAINKNLESQAQAIFKSWFVDFEPFGGEMPRDWKYGNLEDLGQDIVCGKTPSTKRKEYYGGNIPFVTIPDMHNQIYITETERYLSIDGVKTQPTKTLPKNTICVSCIGTAGLVSLSSKECQTNQQINSIIPKDHISPYYVYFLMKSLSETIIRLGGSGSTIVNLNKGQFAKIEVVIPNLEDMSKFTYIVKSNFEMILSNQIENTRLAALRDTLLPRLMSGEIDVENVEV